MRPEIKEAIMKLLNTHNKTDLKKYAQALMMTNYFEIVSLKDITLLEFSGTDVLVNYLLFRIKSVTYKWRNLKLTIDHVEMH